MHELCFYNKQPNASEHLSQRTSGFIISKALPQEVQSSLLSSACTSSINHITFSTPIKLSTDCKVDAFAQSAVVEIKYKHQHVNSRRNL